MPSPGFTAPRFWWLGVGGGVLSLVLLTALGVMVASTSDARIFLVLIASTSGLIGLFSCFIGGVRYGEHMRQRPGGGLWTSD